MKIRKLTIQNIASIENAEIDFDRGPLAADPLFLITGDTGTGKTTILNAICLALYNEVPALGTIGTADDDAEGIRTDNTRQLMRKGTGYSAVELAFEGNDGKNYVASWRTQRAHKKPSGALQSTVRQLLDVESGVTYNRKNEIEAEIKRTVGLTFDQFTRTTLLAQGQFATFMKAADKDKSDILEKLTGTEIYARIGQKIFELSKKKEQELALLEAEIEGAHLLSDETKKEYADNISTLTLQLDAIAQRLKVVDTQYTWLSQATNLKALLDEKVKAESAARQVAESDDITHMQRLVKQWDETTEIRRLIAAERDSCKHLEQLGSNISVLAGEKWHRVLDGIRWMETDCERIERRTAALKASVEAQRVMTALYDNSQRISEMAKNVAKSAADARRYREQSAKSSADAEMSARKEEPLDKQFKQASADFEAQLAAVKRCDEEVRKYDIAKISGELKGIVEQLATIQKAMAQMAEYRKCGDECARAQEQLNNAVEAYAKTEHLYAETVEALPKAREAYTRGDAYLQGQMELKDHIASLRARFADTKVCPLCGNTDAHLHSDEVIDAKVVEAQEAAERAKQQLDRLNSRASELKATLTVQKREVTNCQTVDKRCARALIEAESKAKALVDNHQDEDCITKLQSRLKQIEERQMQLNSSLTEAKTAQDLKDKAAKRLDAIRDDRDAAQRKLDAQRLRTKDLKDASKREAEMAEAAERQSRDALDEIVKITRATAADDSDFAALLKQATGYDSISLDTIVPIADYIATAAKAYAKDTRELDALVRQAQDLERHISDCRSATQPLAARFGDEYEPRAVQCEGIDAAIRNISADVNRLDGEIKAEQQKKRELGEAIERWLAANTISANEVNVIAGYSDGSISKCREAVKTAQDNLVKITHEKGVITEQIAEHDKSRPHLDEDMTVESLKIAKNLIEKENADATTEKAKYEALLKNDEINSRAQEENKKRVVVLRAEKNDWANLNRNFGTADGKQFKLIAQSYLLGILLTKANYYLDMLSRRYRLDCNDGSLTINVVDAHQGGAVRNVGLLSGGESFIVSLALALGLSAISKEKINVDTLFIDEGFGTLDKDILDTVINTLDRLHNVGGRRIGIISHVQDLKERIPTQVRLIRTGPSSSRVEVVTL